MNLLVTGGAGFVGARLTRALQERYPDAQLLVLDDFRTGTFANLCPDGPQGWSFRGQVVARPMREFDLDHLLESFEPDVVFHLASITDTRVDDESKMIADNVEPFETLLAYACESGARLVWASSAATYGQDANGARQARRPFELEDAGRPANVYGFSKWVMENMHRAAQQAHPDAGLVGLRYFNVFGPGEQNKGPMASMVWQLANQMLDGERPRIFHDGEQARDQVYVDDVVDATIAGAGPEAESGVYNVGSGHATSFNQIVEALNEAYGTTHEPDYFENPYGFYQDYTCADLTETERGLKWTPSRTPKQAILEYAEWVRASRG
ncbi:MAG: NAD-dependent epimerase/dehydratase family protein [Planctomycetota bacterium]